MSRRAVASLVAAVAVLALAWYFILWGPANRDLHHARGQLSAAATTNAGLSSQVATLRTIQAKVPTLRSQLAKMDEAIPASAQLAATLDQIHAAAASAGAKVGSLTPTTAAAGQSTSGPQSLQIALAVQGTYSQVMNFIYYLDNMSRLAVVDSTNIGSSGTSASSQLSAQLSIRVFYSGSSTSTSTGA